VTVLLNFFIDNQAMVDRKIVGNAIFGNMVNALKHFSRANTQKGARKNIRDHYDLGNELYENFLDPSMTYSSGIFDNPECSLERAQANKLDAILAKSGISKDEHVLEIGCGWGSFAIRAVQKTGCRVTGITLSDEQKRFAEKKIAELGLSDRIRIQLTDYRQVEGAFDKIVSIEMIEAVGHDYLELFFKTCDRLLKPGGIAVFQAITIPDNRYETYRKKSDWIQKHIFPGGLLPSLGVLKAAIGKTSLKVRGIEPLGPHYARTLVEWRNNFKSRWPTIEKLGFDEVFRRKWEYYFHYCEAGFASGMIDVVQMVLVRQDGPGSARGK
jgi:cyclopropane-fatty-acyl-phospholipid synthase